MAGAAGAAGAAGTAGVAEVADAMVPQASAQHEIARAQAKLAASEAALRRRAEATIRELMRPTHLEMDRTALRAAIDEGEPHHWDADAELMQSAKARLSDAELPVSCGE